MGMDAYFYRTITAVDFDLEISGIGGNFTELFDCLEGNNYRLGDPTNVDGYHSAIVSYKIGQLRKAHHVDEVIRAIASCHSDCDQIMLGVPNFKELQSRAYDAIGSRINDGSKEASKVAMHDWPTYQWWKMHRIATWVINQCRDDETITYEVSV